MILADAFERFRPGIIGEHRDFGLILVCGESYYYYFFVEIENMYFLEIGMIVLSKILIRHCFTSESDEDT